MTLAKTCHASNMMQDLKKQLTCIGLLQPQNFLNRDVSMFHFVLKKIESHLET